MTIIDYLLLAAFISAALYASYRLFFGYLRSRCEELAFEEGDKANSSSTRAPTPNASTTGAPWRTRN